MPSTHCPRGFQTLALVGGLQSVSPGERVTSLAADKRKSDLQWKQRDQSLLCFLLLILTTSQEIHHEQVLGISEDGNFVVTTKVGWQPAPDGAADDPAKCRKTGLYVRVLRAKKAFRAIGHA